MSGITAIMGIGSGGGGKILSQEFLTSGIFTVPDGIEIVQVFLVGGGGSGGSYSTLYNAAGGGGGEIINGYISVKGETTIAITIGSGGNGVTTANGNAGGYTRFGTSHLKANGGGAGGIGTGPASPGVGGGRNIGWQSGYSSQLIYGINTGGSTGTAPASLNKYGMSTGGVGFTVYGGGSGGGVYDSGPVVTAHAATGSLFEQTAGASAAANASSKAGGGGSSYGKGSDAAASANSNDAPANSGAGSGGSVGGSSGNGGSGYALITWTE